MDITKNPNIGNGKTFVFISETESLLNTVSVSLKATNNNVPKNKQIDRT